MVSVYFLSLIFAFTFSHQNGAISVPDTVEDDDESDDGTPSDDLESAVPIEENKGGAVKFGWIRGVLVSYVGSRHSITARSRGSFTTTVCKWFMFSQVLPDQKVPQKLLRTNVSVCHLNTNYDNYDPVPFIDLLFHRWDACWTSGVSCCSSVCPGFLVRQAGVSETMLVTHMGSQSFPVLHLFTFSRYFWVGVFPFSSTLGLIEAACQFSLGEPRPDWSRWAIFRLKMLFVVTGDISYRSLSLFL